MRRQCDTFSKNEHNSSCLSSMLIIIIYTQTEHRYYYFYNKVFQCSDWETGGKAFAILQKERE